MNPLIDHALLDTYERCQGDPRLVPDASAVLLALWERVDELLLDLHLIRHGYANDGYARKVDRELENECADASVAARMRTLRP